MESRMKNPAIILPDAMQALLALNSAIEKGGLPPATTGTCAFASQPDQRMQRLRRHALSHVENRAAKRMSACLQLQPGAIRRISQTPSELR